MIMDWIRGLFSRVDAAAERGIIERYELDRDRALTDPFRFDPRTDDFARNRARHGLSTRRIARTRNPERDPYEALWRENR